jgi:hypothetical protein
MNKQYDDSVDLRWLISSTLAGLAMVSHVASVAMRQQQHRSGQGFPPLREQQSMVNEQTRVRAYHSCARVDETTIKCERGEGRDER